jgi:glutamate/tyrosine decarboxylase-like PLP-dependent enzyme
MADRLGADPDVAILNDVVLNQVLVRFTPPHRSAGTGTASASASATAFASATDAEIDAFTKAVVEAVQAEGTLWLGGRTWHGKGTMRVSVTSWNTTADDIDRSAAAILRCRDAVIRGGGLPA